MSRKRRRRALALASGVALLGLAGFGALAIWAAIEEPHIEPELLVLVAADKGFQLNPPNAEPVGTPGRRTVCVDPSGDPPQVWRDVAVADGDAEEIADFYRSELPHYGWTLRTEPTDPSAPYLIRSSKIVEGASAELHVYIPSGASVGLLARVPCP